MISPCIALKEGQDLACDRRADNKQYQLAIFYTNEYRVDTDFTEDKYRGVIFKPFLKKQVAEINPKRVIFTANENSNIIKGEYSKSDDNFGYAQYKHEVSILISALTEDEKRQIHALNNNVWKVVLFNADRTAELYGSHFGLKTETYNYGLKSEVIKLSSIKDESTMPLFYNGETIGDEYIEEAFKIFDETFDNTFE